MAKKLKKVANEAFATKSYVLCQYLSTIVCSNWFKERTGWSDSEIQNRNRGFASQVITHVWPL